MDARISVNGSQVLTRTNKRFGDFYRPLAPSRWPYSVKVWPAANPSDVKTFLVKVPADGRGVQLDVTFPAAPTPRAQPSR